MTAPDWRDMTRETFDATARDVQTALLPAPDPCGTGDLFELLAECGMCHRDCVPVTYCHDSEDGDYAVCGECDAVTDGDYPARLMSNALAAIAARYVGRRVRLKTGQTGTITRVTSRGYVIKIDQILDADIAAYLD